MGRPGFLCASQFKSFALLAFSPAQTGDTHSTSAVVATHVIFSVMIAPIEGRIVA
jgi:hypothetical protein